MWYVEIQATAKDGFTWWMVMHVACSKRDAETHKRLYYRNRGAKVRVQRAEQQVPMPKVRTQELKVA